MSFSINRLMHDVGLPELAELGSQDVGQLQHLVNASIVGLSDGDVVVLHEPITTGDDMDLFGLVDYRTGRVASAITQAALANDPANYQTDIYGFQNFLAEFYTTPHGQYRGVYRDSAVKITAQDVLVDDRFLVPLPRLPKTVLEYGACLTSVSHIADQIEMQITHGGTFTYIPITRTHFTNAVLMKKYSDMLVPEDINVLFEKKKYIGREDGVSLATQEMINVQEAHNSPTNFADLIISVGIQHMTEADVLDGISRAVQLLSSDGILLIRGFEQVAQEKTGIDTMSDIAQDSGLKITTSLGYTSSGHLDVHSMLAGKQAVRQVKSVAFKLK